MRNALSAAAAAATLAAGLVAATTGSANAAAQTAYDAVYSSLPGNVASVGFEAQGASELGDEVQLAGTARRLNTVTVTMSSWGCENGAWNTGDCSTSRGASEQVPITLSIYRQSVTNPDGFVTPGSLLTKTTQSVKVPYRPTANLKKCNTANNAAGKWYSAKDGTCYNGYAFNVSFNFKSLKLTLPDDVVVGVAYNTTHNGYSPTGESTSCYSSDGGCIYDSLNVGTDGEPTTGTKRYPGTAFFNTKFAQFLCDGGAVAQTGVFNLDSPDNGCYADYTPNLRITTS